jgi:hypothetical protein
MKVRRSNREIRYVRPCLRKRIGPGSAPGPDSGG